MRNTIRRTNFSCNRSMGRIIFLFESKFISLLIFCPAYCPRGQTWVCRVFFSFSHCFTIQLVWGRAVGRSKAWWEFFNKSKHISFWGLIRQLIKLSSFRSHCSTIRLVRAVGKSKACRQDIWQKNKTYSFQGLCKKSNFIKRILTWQWQIQR